MLFSLKTEKVPLIVSGTFLLCIPIRLIQPDRHLRFEATHTIDRIEQHCIGCAPRKFQLYRVNRNGGREGFERQGAQHACRFCAAQKDRNHPARHLRCRDAQRVAGGWQHAADLELWRITFQCREFGDRCQNGFQSWGGDCESHLELALPVYRIDDCHIPAGSKSQLDRIKRYGGRERLNASSTQNTERRNTPHSDEDRPYSCVR